MNIISNLPSGLSVHRSVISEHKINEFLKKAKLEIEKLDIKGDSYSVLYPLGLVLNTTQILEKPNIVTPTWLEDLGKELSDLKLCPLTPNQYRMAMFRDKGVAWHVDSKFFGDFLCTLSLNNNRIIEFRKNESKYQLKLNAGDIYIQQREVRNDWEHRVLQPGGCSLIFSRIDVGDFLKEDDYLQKSKELEIQREKFAEGGFRFSELSNYWN